MKKLVLILIIMAGLMVPLACSNNNPTGPLATFNLTATPTNTFTPTPTNWAGYTSTTTPLYSSTPTNTFTITVSYTVTATSTNTFNHTPTITNTPTVTSTLTATNTATSTCTLTPTSTGTLTPTPVLVGSTWQTAAPPNGLAYDGSATVYVAEGEEGFSGGTIQSFVASAGTVANSYTTIGTYTFGQPNGVAFYTPTSGPNAGTNYLYVLDSLNNTVYQINLASWTLVGSPVTGTGTTTFSGPQGIAVDSSNGNVYIADSNNDYIEEFNYLLVYQSEFGGSSTFNNPNAVAVDGAHNIWVTDDSNNQAGTFNQRVQGFSSTYSPLVGDNFSVAANYPNADLCGITVNSGNVYLADSGSGLMEEFTASGTLLTDGLGISPSNSPSPDGLVFIGSNLLVADYANNRLYLVTP